MQDLHLPLPSPLQRISSLRQRQKLQILLTPSITMAMSPGLQNSSEIHNFYIFSIINYFTIWLFSLLPFNYKIEEKILSFNPIYFKGLQTKKQILNCRYKIVLLCKIYHSDIKWIYLLYNLSYPD